jgi:hypothetical protein
MGLAAFILAQMSIPCHNSLQSEPVTMTPFNLVRSRIVMRAAVKEKAFK